MSLLALIETGGYGINDSMYFIKDEGKGLAWMELIDGVAKVLKMLELC